MSDNELDLKEEITSETIQEMMNGKGDDEDE